MDIPTIEEIMTIQCRLVESACEERMSEYVARAVDRIAQSRGVKREIVVAMVVPIPQARWRLRAWLNGYMIPRMRECEDAVIRSKLTDKEQEQIFYAFAIDLMRKRLRARLVASVLDYRWGGV